jgi:hypothetical protein
VKRPVSYACAALEAPRISAAMVAFINMVGSPCAEVGRSIFDRRLLAVVLHLRP